MAELPAAEGPVPVEKYAWFAHGSFLLKEGSERNLPIIPFLSINAGTTSLGLIVRKKFDGLSIDVDDDHGAVRVVRWFRCG